jgi:diaminopimelate epimerase
MQFMSDSNPTGVAFTKMQAIGNDFVVVDEALWPEGDWAARARSLCDRRFGVGADGLLVVSPSDVADVRMRMFNPDGTEDMCGNGLRCVVRFAHERGRLGTEGTVETLAGVRPVRVLPEAFAAGMGAPRFAPADLPMHASGERVLDFPLAVDGEPISVSVVSTGTTHTVLWVDNLPEDALFFRLSPRLENHPLFPERTSVLWTQVEGQDRLRVRIWERGVGETLGCGTGACAAAVLARVQGKSSAPEIAVASQGGTLRVAWPGGPDDAITLTGPAEAVFTGNWPLPTHG